MFTIYYRVGFSGDWIETPLQFASEAKAKEVKKWLKEHKDSSQVFYKILLRD